MSDEARLSALERLATTVREMRDAQRAYFRSRSPEKLDASKRKEHEVDLILLELAGAGQKRMF